MSKGLIRKIALISKFMTSQHGQQTIAIHILTNISRSKGNQAMIFGQLIELNMRFFLLRNHTQNAMEILIEHISESVFIQLVFMVCLVEDYENTLRLNCRPVALAHIKLFFLKKKKVWD